MKIQLPDIFSYSECMVYINRSELESTHTVIDNDIYKVFKIEDNLLLIKIAYSENALEVSCLNKTMTKYEEERISQEIKFMFDLNTSLEDLYAQPYQPWLQNVFKKHRGLRLIKMNNLFEGFIWAVLGQQINLKFAYTLKKRIVETYGEFVEWNDQRFYCFPEASVLESIPIETFRTMQITQRKSEYIIGLAQIFSSQAIKIKGSYDELYHEFMSIRGIGDWTANYVLMKCYPLNNPFPLSDAGLHNAIKEILKLGRKPTKDELEEFKTLWSEWAGYVTFYLWRTLYV